MLSLVVSLPKQDSVPLAVVTRALPQDQAPEQLLNLLPAQNPLAFVRGGSGIIGYGETVRLTATGENRMHDLARQWRDLVAVASVQNPLSWHGTGLVAFGSIAFADSSTAVSTLIVPKMILGCHDGQIWLTEIKITDDPAEHPAASKNALQTPTDWTEAFAKASFGSTSSETDFHAGEVSPEKFASNVETALHELATTELQKVVLARDVVAKLPSDFDVRKVLRNLGAGYPTCWIYSVDGTIGASPELLVRVSHGQVSARVLAGTAGRGTDPGIDRAIATALAGSAKNLAEHEYAVASLVDALQPFCSQVDADEAPFSLALPNVWHLASDVHGVLKTGASSLDLAAALHPTAAVAGTPRKLALDFIAKVEGVDRGRYAAPVGWISADGDGEWAIALRGGQLGDDNTLRAFAGCGVVAGSTPAAELAETSLKFAPIRDALS